ncbi:MAG TPA: glutaredoxin [Allocoleopsis sp.]
MWSQYGCTHCSSAISLLQNRNVEVEIRKIGVGEKWSKEDLLKEVPTARSVPQIFIDGKYIGGYKELREILF